jgi:hypothetical protein
MKKGTKASPWVWAGAGVGLAVFGVALLAPGTAQAAQAGRGAAMITDMGRRIVRHVLASESGGRYTAINKNTDGAGISVGLIQWSQAGGGLAGLLDAMLADAPDRVRLYLGASTDAVVEVARAKSLAPVEGQVLWSEHWLPRWRALLGDTVLQATQDRVVMSGEHMRGAVDAARTLGLSSVRALTLLFDRAVQQGPGRVRSVASRVAALGLGSEAAVLKAVSDGLVEPFRRETYPGAGSSSRLTWQQVGNRWHLHSGSIDLYATARGRVDAILADPSLV